MGAPPHCPLALSKLVPQKDSSKICKVALQRQKNKEYASMQNLVASYSSQMPSRQLDHDLLIERSISCAAVVKLSDRPEERYTIECYVL